MPPKSNTRKHTTAQDQSDAKRLKLSHGSSSYDPVRHAHQDVVSALELPIILSASTFSCAPRQAGSVPGAASAQFPKTKDHHVKNTSMSSEREQGKSIAESKFPTPCSGKRPPVFPRPNGQHFG